VRLTGDRHVMTVMFTDIEGFTALSEKLPDETLTELLNFYFDEMSPLVLREDGTLDKYIGDSIMSFWNAPLPQADHAFRACRVALALQRRERAIQGSLQERGAPTLATRIGINTGPMVVGDMGSKERFNYTVLGDSVNLGSRLEGANKLYGSRILLARSTAELVKDRFLMRKLDLLLVKGKRTPLAVYELLGERGKALGEPVLLERIKRYESAWELYRQQKWDEAEQVLRALVADHPDDAPAATLLTRIGHLRADPPSREWNGVYVAQVK
jgi:adenylate cyclase